MVDAVAWSEEHRQLDVAETEGRELSNEPWPGVLQQAHERPPSPTLQRCPHFVYSVPGSQETEDAGNACWRHHDWQVNHHRRARLENASDLREVRVRQRERVEVLEDVGGKRTISRGGLHWQSDAVAQSEFDVRLGDVCTGDLQHPVGDVDTDDPFEIRGHRLGEPPSAAADLDDEPEIEAVADPTASEVGPHGLAKR